MILAAAASRTEQIRLTSAVTVLSAADPVRIFQQFSALDLLSRGRAEMVVCRGSFIESFPLFGLKLGDYDDLFTEKLDLLLKIRESAEVHWSGRHRPALTGQGIFPRPVQRSLPIWLGVGGTPESFVRAGQLGLPLMIAIIGGEPHRFRPLVDLYREAGLGADGEMGRINHVRVADPTGLQLTLPHPQAEGLAGDAKDADGLSAADVGLTAGELVVNSGR
jgi:alkanesulfonate monooxygenase SsuD/methylene tetrahydromethanopterin reductase-like flavin-dependent oxidoreductase (luciferase family)